MTSEKLYELLGDISEKRVEEAREYRKAKKPVWLKWSATAACLCLVAAGVLYGINFQLRQYVVRNDISVYSAAEYSDSTSSADVTPEQADRLAAANKIHRTLSAQNYEWYGGCCYDFENDRIMVGLTEVSDSNREAVLAHTGDTAVQFFECEYSYRYLEELYNKLDEKRTMLSLLGADRFNISVEKNRIKVHIASAEKYGAIYAVNETDSLGGAIVFTSDTASADRR